MTRILIINKDLNTITSIRKIIKNNLPASQIITVSSESKILEKAQKDIPDIIILFINGEDNSTIELMKKFRNAVLLKKIPILLLSSIQNDSKNRVKFYKLGAEVILPFPLEESELIAQIKLLKRIKTTEEKLRFEKDRLEKLWIQRINKLSDNEKKYRKLFQTSNEAIIIHDLKGQIVETNKQAQILLGYKKDEFYKIHLNNLHPDNVIKSLRNFIRAVREKGSLKFEIDFQKKNGAIFPAEVTTKFLSVDKKKVVLATIRDIGKQKKYEAKIRESELKYRQLFEENLAGVFESTLTGKILNCNNAFANVFGYKSAKSLIGKNARMFYESPGQRQKFVAELKKEKAVFADEFPLRTKNGKKIWIIEDTYLSGAGTIRGTILDVTKLVKGSITLKKEKEKAERYLKIAKVMFVALDKKGIVTMINKKGCEILGYNEDELIGKNWFDIVVPPSEKVKVRKIFNKIIRGKSNIFEYYENCLVTKNSEKKIIAFQNTLLKNEDDEIIGTLSSGEDITKQREAKNLLKKSNRAFKMLSDCNQILLRADDEKNLINEICKVIVEQGGYRFSWIGYVKHDKRKSVIPIASYGLGKEYLKTLNITWANSKSGKGPTGTAIRTGKPSIIKNITTDPKFSVWRKEALKNNFASSIALPLISENKVFGTLNIYSSEPDSFKDEEFKLLSELSRDLAFGITVIRNADKKRKVEMELRESESKFKQLAENINEIFFLSDPDKKKMLYISPAFEKIWGQSVESLYKSPTSFADLVYPDDKAKIQTALNDQAKGVEVNIEFRIVKKDGSIRWINTRAYPVFNKDGKLYRIAGVSTDITEKKTTEIALKESEERFKNLISLSPVGIVILQNNKIIFANQSFLESFEYSSFEEVIGLSIIDFIHPDFKEIAEERLKRLSHYSSKVKWLEEVFITKKNNIRNVLVFGQASTYRGKPAIQGYIYDITERRKAQKELRESEQKFRTLFNEVPIGITVTSINGKIIMANEVFQRTIGYSLEELNNINARKLYAEPNERKRYIKTFKSNRFVRNYLLKLKKKDGTTYFANLNAVPIRLNGIDYILTVSEDITEKRKVEERIRQLSRSVEQSPTLVVITDYDGNIQYINPKVTEVTGYTSEELIGKNPRIYQSGITPTEKYRDLWETIKSGGVWKGELLNRKKNGELYWEYAIITSIKNEEGKITHFLALNEDITDKKRIKDELIRAKEEAVKADKLKSEFLAQMSHEIRSPLNVMINFSSLLKENLSDEKIDEYQDIFNSIENSGRRIIRTVDSILNMSELQSGTYDYKKTKIDLDKKILSDIYRQYKGYADNKGIKLIYNNKILNTEIYADEYSVYQIFVNLVDNAIKYTHQGSVEIIMDRDENKKIRVRVKDTGIGIAKEFLPVLFEAFRQEEQGYTRSFEGNGLGLALVKRYCALNNAAITVESKKGKGTQFTVVFKDKT